jgi:hypothetical protein
MYSCSEILNTAMQQIFLKNMLRKKLLFSSSIIFTPFLLTGCSNSFTKQAPQQWNTFVNGEAVAPAQQENVTIKNVFSATNQIDKEYQELVKATSRLGEGSVLLARNAPQMIAEDLNTSPSNQVYLGFTPQENTIKPSRITLSLKDKEILISDVAGEFTSAVKNIHGSVTQGNYSVVLKQQNPLWHASDDYFKNRGLEIPLEGSKNRFLKGALGSKVLFITPELAFHDAPFWTDEVKGIRVSSQVMKKLYDIFEIGAEVVITN